MAMRTQPTLSPSMLARIAEVAALSPSSFRKRYRSSYETPSSSLSPTLPVRKRYRGTYELILDNDSEGDELGEEDIEEDEEDENDEGWGFKDEGTGMEKEEDAAPEGQQYAVTVVNTAASEPLGRGYEAARYHALELTKEITPSTYEVGQSSRSVPEQEGVERISAFRQPTLVTWVDPEDGRVYTDILTYVPLAAPVQTPPSPEWSLGSLPVSPSSLVVPSPIALSVATLTATISRLDALPPTLFEGYDRDLRELYTRSGAVRDEIFLQRYRFRSLEREQERATVTFSAIWRSRENHDLRRQLAKERRERLELTGRVARMERRQESGGE
ncbi:hypothetical protein Tco_1245906 [Tanacetum coccineum]